MTTQTKDERTKQQIREAARSLFQKWGLHKTTMEDIAKAARKGKSTLYYYFKSKNEIIDEIVSEEFRLIFERARVLMDQEPTSEGKLRTYLLSMVKETRRRVTAYQVSIAEISNFEPIISKLRKEYDDEEQSVIAKVLAEGVESGELRWLADEDIHHLSYFMSVLLKTLLAEHVAKGTLDEASGVINTAIGVFTRGLLK